MSHRLAAFLTAPILTSSLLLFGAGVLTACYLQYLQHSTTVLCQEHLASLRAAQELPPAEDVALAQACAANLERGAWALFTLLLLGSLAAGAGVVACARAVRGLRRALAELAGPMNDTAEQLSSILGPPPAPAAGNLAQLHGALHHIAAQVPALVRLLQQRQRELLRATQLAQVGQLAAGLAHELRNPLMAIKMLVEGNHAEALARGMPSEDLALIEEEIGRLERRLSQFLNFAQPPRMQRQAVLLESLVKRTMLLIRARAERQHVRVLLRLANPGHTIVADVEQLQQLLLNLALNALDAMPKGGTLEIATAASAEALTLSVRDNGPGLSAQILPRLFEPFASTKPLGLGLGLAVSRHIAEKHDGTLTAHNRPHAGACFALQLPLSTEPRPEVDDGSDEMEALSTH